MGNGPGDAGKPSEKSSIHRYRRDRIRRLGQKTQRNFIVIKTSPRLTQIGIKNRYPCGSPRERWIRYSSQKRFRCWRPRSAPSSPTFSFCKQGSRYRLDCRECPRLKRAIKNRLPHILARCVLILTTGAGQRTRSLKLAFYGINERKLTGLVDWN